MTNIKNEKTLEKKSLKNNELDVPVFVKEWLQHIDIPEDFLDVYKVMIAGALKHGKDTWMDEDNPSLKLKANYASINRHAAEYYCGVKKDHESGLDPLLHLATRCLMSYTRRKRGIEQ